MTETTQALVGVPDSECGGNELGAIREPPIRPPVSAVSGRVPFGLRNVEYLSGLNEL